MSLTQIDITAIICIITSNILITFFALFTTPLHASKFVMMSGNCNLVIYKNAFECHYLSMVLEIFTWSVIVYIPVAIYIIYITTIVGISAYNIGRRSRSRQ